MLLTDRPGEVLPTIASRCQHVRFDAPRRGGRGAAESPACARAALACARLSLGDGERALALALGDGPALRARAEAFARAPLPARRAARPWQRCSGRAASAGGAARGGRGRARGGARVPAQEGARRKQTETPSAPAAPSAGAHRRDRPGAAARRAVVPRRGVRGRRRARARATTAIGSTTLRGGRRRPRRDRGCPTPSSWSTTPAPGWRSTSTEELALEALAYRLERCSR